ncbi:YhdP family protein [Thalassotalea sp. Y01]|uniref:YhdP family protein n=1 Tax=Thalassotalea sp. Y01 TaxID=2729613 RepID=UPI00145F96A6|nr:TIGR02099 family protein [Thalassotalea sp. Y01]
MDAFWAYLNTWLNRLYKTLAVLLVLLAVLITSARILLPHAPAFKEELEDVINSRYDGEISIGELSAGWEKFGPTLILRDVDLLNSAALSVRVNEIDVRLDFWYTLTQQKLKIHNFTLDGAQINLDQTQISADRAQAETDIDAIFELLFKQVSRFSVINSKIHHTNRQRTQTLLLSKLAWHNDGKKHHGIGKLEIEGISAKSAKLLINLEGNTRDKVKGNIYLSGTDIDATDWLTEQFGERADRFSSRINLETWLHIEKGKLTQAHLTLGENEVSWFSFDEQHTLSLPKGHISLYREMDNPGHAYTLFSSELPLFFDQQAWQPLSFNGYVDGTELLLHVSDIDLQNLWQVFSVVEQESEQAKAFASLNLRGELTDISLHSKGTKFRLTTDINEFGVDHANGIPGIANLDGQLLLTNSQVQLNITARDSALDFADGFSRPIPFNELHAKANVSWQQDAWRLQVEDIKVSSDELTVEADVQYQQQADNPGWLSLYAYVTEGDASKAQYYLPLPIMDPGLVEYLTEAIGYGEITQAGVLVNGPVNTFPYLDRSGAFIVDADLHKAKYTFESSWPAITDADLNLNFTNDAMFITAYDGTLAGIETKGVEVGIATLSGDSILTVRTQVEGKAKDVAHVMNNSPLAESVGSTLQHIGPEGFISGTFSLDLPLSDTDNAVAKGVINFADNKINLAAPEMDFDRVNGQLTFVNDYITTKDINVYWRGMPMKLNVKGQTKDDFYRVDIDLDAAWQPEHYNAQIPKPLQTYVQGQADWQGKLKLFIPSEGDISYRLDLDSNLEKAQLNLPKPYLKKAKSKRSLAVKVRGDANKSSIEASLGDNLSFSGELDHQKVSFKRAQLVLGTQKMVLPMDGFHITTSLKRIEYDPWHKFIFAIIDSLPDDKEIASNEESYAFLEAPERIRGNVDTVDLYGVPIHHVDFNLLFQQDWWLLQLNSDEIRGRIKFFHEFEQRGLEVDADFIHFQDPELLTEQTEPPEQVEVFPPAPEKNDAEQANISPADFPNLKLTCDSCKYQLFDFGKVTLELEKSDGSMVLLRDFTATRKKTELKLSGSWRKDSIVDITELSGTLNTADVEKELAIFDIQSGIKDSGFKSSYELKWKGGPHQFNVESLSGKAKARLDDGYLAEVSDQGARLFSVLSLQSLIRKLTLDFRDVFAKGMFYSDFKGDFTVVNGVVYTDNLKMNGAAGNLTIQGNTSLVNHQLDYRMSFAPKVTSSLPVIAAWLFNPLAGAAALVVNEAIEKAEVISVITFELTGTVAEPSFKEVDRKSRNVNVGKSKPDLSDLQQQQDQHGGVQTASNTNAIRKPERKDKAIENKLVADKVSGAKVPETEVLDEKVGADVNSDASTDI